MEIELKVEVELEIEPEIKVEPKLEFSPSPDPAMVPAPPSPTLGDGHPAERVKKEEGDLIAWPDELV